MHREYAIAEVYHDFCEGSLSSEAWLLTLRLWRGNNSPLQHEVLKGMIKAAPEWVVRYADGRPGKWQLSNGLRFRLMMERARRRRSLRKSRRQA